MDQQVGLQCQSAFLSFPPGEGVCVDSGLNFLLEYWSLWVILLSFRARFLSVDHVNSL